MSDWDSITKCKFQLDKQTSEHFLIQKIGYLYGVEDGKRQMWDKLEKAISLLENVDFDRLCDMGCDAEDNEFVRLHNDDCMTIKFRKDLINLQKEVLGYETNN